MAAKKPLRAGDQAPDFCLSDQDGKRTCLRDYRGRWVVLYFYPKDNTPGCTLEAVEFTCRLTDFDKLGAEVLGVSPDSVKSHQNFAAAKDLKLTLLSDPEHEVLELYSAWGLKKMYGKEYEGAVRSTYLIDPEGNIAHVWPKVQVKGHVGDVLQMILKLQNA